MLRLTTENLPAAYEYLRACEPFSRWKLPEADQIEFRVTRHADRFGHFDDRDGKEAFTHIAISEVFVKNTQTLMEVMGHEMTHAALFYEGDAGWARHGAAFKRKARSACRRHGWDLKAF